MAANAVVETSVVMRGAAIGNGARIRRAIIEEGVQIPAGAEIGHDRAEDSCRYIVTNSGIVVVSRHALDARPGTVREPVAAAAG